MTRAANFPDGYELIVFGQAWYFSPGALQALEVCGPITESTLGLCAANLGRMVGNLEGSFEVNYFGAPLRGSIADGAIRIEVRPKTASGL